MKNCLKKREDTTVLYHSENEKGLAVMRVPLSFFYELFFLCVLFVIEIAYSNKAYRNQKYNDTCQQKLNFVRT